MKRLSRKLDQDKVILDIKGLLIHMLNRGSDPDALLEHDSTKKVNTAGFGFKNWLEEYFSPILSEHSPQQIIAVWDSGHLYRSRLYSGYKGHKKDFGPVATIELEKLMAHTKSFLAALGVTQCTLEGQEADDVIAFLCERIPEFKRVYTVDRDLLQLSNDDTLVYIQGNAENEFKGYPVSIITLYKSLVGDSSDNIPGVKGFGEKGFKDIYEKFDEDGMLQLEQCIKSGNFSLLETAIEQSNDKHLKKIYADRFGEPEEGRVGWQMSYKLVQLAPWLCEKRYAGKLPQLTWFKRIPNRDRCLDALNSISCGYLMSDFDPYFGQQILITRDNEDYVRQLISQGAFEGGLCNGFDVESADKLKHQPFQEARKGGDYVDVLSQELTGASFCFGDNLQHCIYISVDHAETDNCDPSLILDVLKACDTVTVHNASFEVQVIRQSFDDWILRSPVDTAVMAVMIDEEDETGLKHLSKKNLGYTQVTYGEIMQGARNKEIRALLSCHPGSEEVYEKLTGVNQQIEELSFSLKEFTGEVREMTKTQIDELKSERKSLMGSEIYKSIKPQLDTINAKNFDMSDITGEEVLGYGCDDAVCAAHLHVLFDLIQTLEQTRDFTYRRSFDPVHPLNQAFEQGENLDLATLAKLEEEDSQLIDKCKSRIRELLSQHRVQPCAIRSDEFFTAEHQYMIAKWREDKKGESPDYINYKMRQAKDELFENTKYIPMRTFKEPAQFIPTPKKLDAVRESLGMDIEITKVTKNFLADWAETVEQPTTEAELFVHHLVQAVDELKDRDGENYEQLKSFCEHILTELQPTKTEGDELNFGSPKQMTDLLYLKVGLPVRNRTRPQRGSFRDKNGIPGSPATDKDAIALAMANDTEPGSWKREVLELILEASAAITRGSYYYTPYPKWVHPRDGRVHGSVRFPSTTTRRPTASSPNFLQVTKKDGGKVRSIFRPARQDSVCVAIDFAGQELRITASESKDPVMLDAYLSVQKKDIHSVTATAIAYMYLLQNNPEIVKKLGINAGSIIYETYVKFLKDDDEDVSSGFKAVRTIAKTINFLIIYGGSPKALSIKLAMPMEVAKMIMKLVMKSYARLDPWKEEVLDFARTYGFVLTAYGNRRHVDNKLFAKDDGVRGHAERQTINSVIQACAADILTEVLSTAQEEGVFAETQADIHEKANGVVPIYDEIKAYCPVSSVWDYVTQMQRIMNLTPPGHQVPMLAEVSIGPDWGSMVELGANPTQEQVLEASVSHEPGKLITFGHQEAVSEVA